MPYSHGSALKQGYRDQLNHVPDTRFAYLKGAPDLIYRRLSLREGHFMKPEVLASQFADLEEQVDAIIVGVSSPPEQIAAEIKRRLMTTDFRC